MQCWSLAAPLPVSNSCLAKPFKPRGNLGALLFFGIEFHFPLKSQLNKHSFKLPRLRLLTLYPDITATYD